MQNKTSNLLENSKIKGQIKHIMPKFCDRCGAKYSDTSMEIVGESKMGLGCRLNCSNCGNSYMFHLNSPMDGMLAARRAEIKSEMTTNEIRKFSTRKAFQINSDEIIDVFKALEAVNTIEDFNKLVS